MNERFDFVVRMVRTDGGNGEGSFLGSGIVVAPRWMLTCRHVIEQRVPVPGGGDRVQHRYTATELGIDPRGKDAYRPGDGRHHRLAGESIRHEYSDLALLPLEAPPRAHHAISDQGLSDSASCRH